MTFTRAILYGFLLVLLCLLGAGVYCYRNLEAIIERQAITALRDYGVREIQIARPQFSRDRLHTEEIRLRGELNGLAFDATLTSLEVTYHWRMLLGRELQSITLAKLNLNLVQTTAGADPTDAVSISFEELLPRPYIAELPVALLNIGQWHLDYESPQMPAVSATGSLLVTDELDLQAQAAFPHSHASLIVRTIKDASPLDMQITLAEDNAGIAHLNAQLQSGGAGLWHWQAEGEVHHARLLAWLRRLEQDPGLPVELSAIEGVIVQGHTAFSGDISHGDSINISNAAGATLLTRLSAAVTLDSNIQNLTYPATAEGINGRLHGAVALEEGGLAVVIEPAEISGSIHTALLPLSADVQHWLRWDQTVPIHWQHSEPVELHYTGDNNWSLQLGNSLLALGSKNSELRLEGLNAKAVIQTGEQMNLDSQLAARVKARLRKQQLPQLDLLFQQRGSLVDSEFSVVLEDTAESMRLDLQAAANLDTGKGKYHLDAHSPDLPYAASTVLPLLDYFGLMGDSVEINSGQLSLTSDLVSQSFKLADLQQASQLDIRNLSGIYQEYRFAGMTVSANWSGTERWQTSQPIAFTMASFDAGFEVVDIHAVVDLPQATQIARPRVEIEEFSAGMFGGRVYLPQPRQWDFGAASNSLTLRAEKWQLADMVALQQGQDIRARGVLEGELPVTMADGRIIIEKGYLRALPPGGSIAYVANEASRSLASGSPELQLALDLLSDFQYQVLSSEVKLDKAGNLLLGLSLAGQNPAHYEGRPINFNINLEQNLDPLLQSLRLSDKLVEQLESRIH